MRVPRARIGAIIGKEGETKQKIEETLDIAIDIDTESGQTHISSRETTGDPLAVWKGRDVIKAIARGFSPEKALALIEDGMCFEIIDLEDYFGKSENSLRRVKGRIIGRNGTTRKIIENMTGVRISVYGRTVALIGRFENVQDARRALDMLMRGCMHSTVYKFLENLRRKRKMKERKSIWK